MQEKSLKRHLLSQHTDFEQPPKCAKVLEMMEQAPATYQDSIPMNGIQTECPVPGCAGRAITHSNLGVHFAHQHPTDIIIVAEDLVLRCISCIIFMPTTIAHFAMKWCQRGSVSGNQNWSVSTFGDYRFRSQYWATLLSHLIVFTI
jgi:hypothetical protein